MYGNFWNLMRFQPPAAAGPVEAARPAQTVSAASERAIDVLRVARI
jgi:hypothetical protein